MSGFGWIHISGTVTGQGPSGSIQFLGNDSVLTGSSKLVYHTASNSMYFTGSLIISGNLQAHQFDVIQTNTIEINQSGSTIFGDSCDDTHVLTGSLIMASGAVRQYYKKVTAASYTIKSCDSIVGISSSAYVSLLLPSASTEGAGRILTIKDEYQITRTLAGNTHIALTASGADKIDHQTNYVIEGDSVALTLYSDGAGKWFIY